VRAYLDHASVSPLRPEVRQALGELLDVVQADPGRPYDEALVTRQLIEDARESVARLARATPRQVVFTASIAESVTTAVTALGSGGRILSGSTERTSVLEAARRVGELVEIPVDRLGHLDLDALEVLLSQNPVALVCGQVANHETGTLSDATGLVEIARRHGAAVHLDASMAFGHLDLDLGGLDADAVTVAGELLGGPMGTAVIIVRRGRVLPPLVVGGSQERARRAGLENLSGIVGMGVAAEVLTGPGIIDAEATRARAQIESLERFALATRGVSTVGDPDPLGRAPHVRCFTVEGVEAEPILLGLNRAGISIHSGSACSSESLEPSPVLAAMGLDADRSLRLSVGWSTTSTDVDRFTERFDGVVESLRALRT